MPHTALAPARRATADTSSSREAASERRRWQAITTCRVSVDPVLFGWIVCLLLVITALVTYTRLPASAFFGVDGEGIGLGLSRTITLIGYPIALVAPTFAALAWAVAPTRRGLLALAAGTALCATAALPGVLDSEHLNARPVNALAAIGVAICLWLTVAARRGGRTRIDVPIGPAVIAGFVLLVASLPWICAQLGFYVGDIPVLREIYMSKRIIPEAGYPMMRAVHLGNHEGLDGAVLLLLAALLLPAAGKVAPARLRVALLAYLSLSFWYGAAVFVGDGWHEQVVKRGWYPTKIPNALQPAANITWLIVLIAATGTFLLLRARAGRRFDRAGDERLDA